MTWTEKDSKEFMDFGNFFIPYRLEQAKVVSELLGGAGELKTVVDLCCGQGFWCEKILSQYPDVLVYGYDISEEMLKKASQDLIDYADRFNTKRFDLGEKQWRHELPSVDAFVSSLAIHHLDGIEKRTLYSDLYARLNGGGALLIADIVSPARPEAYHVAARQWQDSVKTKAEKEGIPSAYREFVEEKWNFFYHPDEDPVDQPSGLFEQLIWLKEAGFKNVDVYWMYAGHAIFGGWK